MYKQSAARWTIRNGLSQTRCRPPSGTLMQYQVQFLDGLSIVVSEVPVDAGSPAKALLLVSDIETRPEVAWVRVLDRYGRVLSVSKPKSETKPFSESSGAAGASLAISQSPLKTHSRLRPLKRS